MPSPEGGDGTEVNLVVSGLVRRRQLALPDQAHQISFEAAPKAVYTRMDAITLERVVSNVVENAFTHGRPPVRVRARRPPSDSADDWVVVEVGDLGPGMDPELLARATDRFTRAPEARARPGAGLGLSMVEQLVTDVGGEVRLCHQVTHTDHGPRAPVPCDHPSTMTVSILLPTVLRTIEG